MSKLGKKLIKAAKEARAIARGEADPKTYRLRTFNVQSIRNPLKGSLEETKGNK